MRLKACLLALCLVVLSYQQCGDFRGQKGGKKTSSSTNPSLDTDPGDDPLYVPPPVVKAEEMKAITIYQRLATKVSATHPDLEKMSSLISEGRNEDAADLVTKTDEFYNVVVRDFAARMSNREESVSNPLNDFTATVIGVVRDDIDARELLTGNYFYYAPNAVGVVNKDILAHVVRSNVHYAELDEKHVNLAKSLVKTLNWRVIGNGTTMENLADPAGVLTSRAFMSSHATAGTNRRIVEFAMKEFMCAPIAEWADTKTPDGFVGRDIGRMPSSLYRSKCVGCHAPMDALRPAFAHVNFKPTGGSSGYFEYKVQTTTDPSDDNPAVNVATPASERLVPSKFRRGKRIFPDGYAVENDNWENYIADSFGWRTSKSGRGMNGFGQMLSKSRRFSECMVKRVYQTVCFNEFPADEPELLRDLADGFESGGYNLRKLFARMVVREECTGKDL